MIRGVLTVLMILSTFVSIAAAQAIPTADASAEERRLVEKIKDAVMKDLREGSVFQEHVEIGIQNFIRKQEEA